MHVGLCTFGQANNVGPIYKINKCMKQATATQEKYSD